MAPFKRHRSRSSSTSSPCRDGKRHKRHPSTIANPRPGPVVTALATSQDIPSPTESTPPVETASPTDEITVGESIHTHSIEAIIPHERAILKAVMLQAISMLEPGDASVLQSSRGSADDLASDSGYDTESEFDFGGACSKPSKMRICYVHVKDEANDGDDEADEGEEPEAEEPTSHQASSDDSQCSSTQALVLELPGQVSGIGGTSHTRVGRSRAQPLDDHINAYQSRSTGMKDSPGFRPADSLYLGHTSNAAFDRLRSRSSSSSFYSGHSFRSEGEPDRPTTVSRFREPDDAFENLRPCTQAYRADADIYADRTDMTESDLEFFDTLPPSTPPTMATALSYWHGEDEEHESDDGEDYQFEMEKGV